VVVGRSVRAPLVRPAHGLPAVPAGVAVTLSHRLDCSVSVGSAHLLLTPCVGAALLFPLASVVRPVMHLQDAVIIEESRLHEHRDECVRVSLPLAGDGYVLGVVPAQVAVGSVVNAPPPEAVKQADSAADTSHSLASGKPACLRMVTQRLVRLYPCAHGVISPSPHASSWRGCTFSPAVLPSGSRRTSAACGSAETCS